MISPLLFSCYIDNLLSQLQHSGLGCHVGLSYAGAFGYADDIALLAPSLQCLKGMISICEEYARSHSITFNPNKSKLLCYNADLTGVVPQLYLNGEIIPVVESDKHLGNYILTNIHDRNIIGSVSDLYQRSNWVIIIIIVYSPISNVKSYEFSGLIIVIQIGYGQQMTVNNSMVNKLPTR